MSEERFFIWSLSFINSIKLYKYLILLTKKCKRYYKRNYSKFCFKEQDQSFVGCERQKILKHFIDYKI